MFSASLVVGCTQNSAEYKPITNADVYMVIASVHGGSIIW